VNVDLADIQIAEFLRRGWSDSEMKGLMGGNLLRVMRDAEAVKAKLISRRPSSAVHSARTDLPATDWGGPNGAYLPPKVKQLVDKRRVRDEL
jgi:membrane dipeptidase